jgi:ParB/RepB/Spo0J family partition protein
MSTTLTRASMPTPVLLMQDHEAVAPTDAILLHRLGLTSLPAHETLFVTLNRIMLPQAPHLVRSARRLVKSMQQVGVLQPPSVVLHAGNDLYDPEATFAVIAGRRRVLAAQLAGLSVIKCEAYLASTIPFTALITLIENEQRSAAWIKEVEALRHLLDEKVGLTMDDLAAFGFDRAQLAERLKIAHLPDPLLNRVLSGHINRETARKLVRLTVAQQAHVAALAAAGEEITAERVKQALRVQIENGLVPIQAHLRQEWQTAPLLTRLAETQPHQLASSTTGTHTLTSVPVAGAGQDEREGYAQPSCSTVLTMVEALHTFTHSAEYQGLPLVVHTLTIALQQQLQLALRALNAQPEVSSHAQLEREETSSPSQQGG